MLNHANLEYQMLTSSLRSPQHAAEDRELLFLRSRRIQVGIQIFRWSQFHVPVAGDAKPLEHEKIVYADAGWTSIQTGSVLSSDSRFDKHNGA